MSFDLMQRNNGGHYTDPRDLIPLVYAANSIGINDGGAVDLSTTADCWTSVNNFGIALNSAYLADTWKTVGLVSDAGFLYGAIGPTASNNADFTSMRFTLDGGTPFTLTMKNNLAGNRAMILAKKPMRSDAFTATTNPVSLWGTYASLDSNGTRYPYDWGAQIVPQDVAEGFGARMVRFRSSLLVEMKITNAQSGTGSHEQQSGFLYRRRL